MGRICAGLAACARLAACALSPTGRTEIRIAEGSRTWVSGGDGGFSCEDFALAIPPDPSWDARAGVASAPIRLNGGVLAGDVKLDFGGPQRFDARTSERLADLADIVARNIDLLALTPEADLNLREARLIAQETVRAAPIPVAVIDLELNLLASSGRWRRELGEFQPGMSIFDLLPEAREAQEGQWRARLGDDQITSGRVGFTRPDGGRRWLQTEVMRWRREDGQPGGLIIVAQDVTELVEALEAANGAQERLNLAAEIAEVHVWEFDFQKKHLLKFGAEDTFFDKPITYEDMRQDMYYPIHPQDRDRTRQENDAGLAQGKPVRVEYRCHRHDDKEVWSATTTKLVFGDKGRVVRVLGAMQNITARKFAEREMEKAKLEAESANRAKSEFLANMSHEIRTPMNGIIGMNALLMRTELAPEQRKFAEAVRVSADCLLGIINDILDISKLEAGKVELESIDFRLADVVEDVAELMSPRAAEKSLEIASYVDEAARAPLKGDPTRIRQVLLNLVSNAVKFTETGYVSIEVKSRPGKAGRTALRIEVRDTGIGLDEAAKSKLFLKFQQADGSITRKYGGTGLGLSICKELVNLMGGQIGVADAPGGGSIFYVEIALARGEAAPRPKTADANLAGVRILVVDDIDVNRSIFSRQLIDDGAICVEAESGEQALRLIRKADRDGEQFQIVLSDHMMPDMSGDMLAAAVLREPLADRPKMVRASSVGAPSPTDVEIKGLFDAFLTKPVRHQALVNCLCEVLSAGAAAPELSRPRPAATRDPAHRRGRILLAEDNEINTMLACTILEEAGYEVVCVANGAQAVEAAEGGGFDLILMDVQMPVMDGLQATRAIRALDGVAGRVTIMAMTANAMRSDQDNCLAAGMDDFVSKPIDPEGFLRALERHIGKVDADEPTAPGVGAETDAVDLDEAQLDGLERLLPAAKFRTVIEGYLAAAKERLDRIESRARDLDFLNLAREAHDLKGTSGNFGARRLQALAEQLETACKLGDAAQTNALLPQIRQASDRAWTLVERRVSGQA
jgi:PAS domain S-box-containing protein